MNAPVDVYSSWPVACVKDMDADGYPDVVLESSSDHRMLIYYMTNGVYHGVSPIITNTQSLGVSFKTFGYPVE